MRRQRSEARNQKPEIGRQLPVSDFWLLASLGPTPDASDGAIAQLGERLLCKQEVVGSIPSGSTNFMCATARCFLSALLRAQMRDRAMLLPRAKFRGRLMPPAIFYIVKRGST